ncbi:alpha-L-rhamnosidase-related protein [Mucilaginibacter glaciei]|uniref:Alpha-L-rhamnosidase N-terminal domain-containing protein n=1 Tax=Mucilaginibacter glaciei TaxID=2772109 RepID=A0A926NQT0_9SPHI|nr:alpha-L-rhamnosidase N-terminal domain-containing protein [Mucilaginibacter glaciei]MBD1393663.1 alpha-L-rhamnosidase N-terminal domain-containing protein [Mucilaginibacter glaciei]
MIKLVKYVNLCKPILGLATGLLCFLIVNPALSQTINPAILSSPWKAQWIAAPNEPAKGYGVYNFRKRVDLAAKPARFIIHVSADNRYKLYVNERLVSLGPARGDLYYWNFETVDIAPYLSAGKNTIAAIVWNEGDVRAEAQISDRTGFILQGDTEAEEILNTNKTWKCIRNKAYQPLTGIGYSTYYVAGPGEMVDQHQTTKGWMVNDFDDNSWLNASRIDNGNPKGTVNASGWMLVPSSLPQMELKGQRLATTRWAKGITLPAAFPATRQAVTISANTTASILLDQSYLTNAYVTLNLSGGDKAGISLTYAESPMVNVGNTYQMVKPNRNEVEGYKFVGRKDSITADGTTNQTFTTLAFRTFRYILVNITTHEQPLVIEDLYGTFTGYPFKQNAMLQTANPELQQMLDIGWRTARSCAVETYFDCPYYEQLQYIGDGRIQALISYYNSGDDRLARSALNQMDHSRLAEGITLSRHPSSTPQIISTFSLWYISMLHDYWMYRNDADFVKNKMDGVRQVLAFFSKYQQADGSLKNPPYWRFVDWVGNTGWFFGQPPKDANGNSAILDMQLLWTYRQAAELEAQLGLPVYAQMYREKAAQLKATIQKKYWDAGKKLYADTRDKQSFSQHANALAILSGMVSGSALAPFAKKLEKDTALTQCTIYFKYYLHQALVKGGLGDDYMNWMDVWRNNIKMGLTTWAEISDLEHVRSDCHAWGASPNIEFYRTVLGIDSYAPGFAKIKIEPHLGQMQSASGQIPHPNGKVIVSYANIDGKWLMDLTLPVKTTGTFVWKGKSYPLKTGRNALRI